VNDPSRTDSSDGVRRGRAAVSQTNRARRLAAVAWLAERQAGLLTRRQLRGLGWTDGQVDHEVRYGRWHAPARGVLALQNAPLSPDQRLWLGVLHAGPAAVLSHLTAARCAGLRWHGDETIHVLTAKGDLVPPLDGFFFHQSRRQFRRWGTADEPGPPRLRVEHAVLLAAERDRSVRRAIGLLAASVQQGLTTPDQLLFAAPQIRKLRHGRHFLLALGDIDGGAQSFAEIDVGRLCREAGLAAPVRQVVRVDADGRRRYLDCEWRAEDGRVVVLEVDGSFHLEVGHWWRDMERERDVVISGRVVLRCASVELRLDPQRIVRDLRRAGVPPLERFVWVS
jgi:hypothetical protein